MDGSEFTVVVDTREQNGYSFSCPTVRRKLNAGDYSVEGLEDRVAVERKSLADFVSTVIHARKRFYAELEKLARLDHACVVVEASLRDVLDGAYRGGAHPNAILGAAVSISVAYKTPVFFCDDRQTARHFVEAYLERCWRVAKQRAPLGDV